MDPVRYAQPCTATVYKSVVSRMGDLKMNRSPCHELFDFFPFLPRNGIVGGGATKGHLRHRYSGEKLPACTPLNSGEARRRSRRDWGIGGVILPAKGPRVIRCSRFCEVCLGLKVKIDKETWNTQTSAGVCRWRWRRFIVSSTDSNT